MNRDFPVVAVIRIHKQFVHYILELWTDKSKKGSAVAEIMETTTASYFTTVKYRAIHFNDTEQKRYFELAVSIK